MKPPDSAIGTSQAFGWKTYGVSRADKEPLLRFIIEALQMRGCRVVNTPPSNRAPFYLVFETPAGERRGLLVYAFFANSEQTRNRPIDEHRFQIKYGSKLKGVLEVAVDPQSVVTTIFLGIDTERQIFVAADPSMNNPSPMSRSIEFKAQNVRDIVSKGWAVWERDRRPGKTKTRPVPEYDEDERTQILVGGRKERLFDLVQFEQIACGLESGERHLIAEKLFTSSGSKESQIPHRLLGELNIEPNALFDLIQGAARLKMAVRGWVAETHLETTLKRIRGVTECRRIEAEGQPDITLRWKGSQPVLIECKNVLRKTDAKGQPRVDFQRTRASKVDPCSRYYRAGDFAILAACLHPVTEKWDFNFALTSDLPAHVRCPGRIASNIIVSNSKFASQPESAIEKYLSGLRAM
jgi:hypothetical protein